MKFFRALCVIVFALGVGMLALSIARPANVVQMPSVELNAVTGIPAPPSELGWTEVKQDDMPYRLYICGVCDVSDDGSVDVWFYNPDDNQALLTLNVYQDDDLLCETGFLKPGEYLESVQLSSVPADGSAITYQIVGYEPDTYYSLGNVSLNTEVS